MARDPACLAVIACGVSIKCFSDTVFNFLTLTEACNGALEVLNRLRKYPAGCRARNSRNIHSNLRCAPQTSLLIIALVPTRAATRDLTVRFWA